MFSGFWGLKIVPGKTYTQTVDASFRVSNASLGEEIANEGRTSVLLTVHQKRFVLCALTPGKIEQQLLDITLTEGEEITFETFGENEVHLTGNFIADDEDDDEDGMYGSSDEEDGEDIDLDNITPEGLQELINRGMIDPSDLQIGDDESDEDYDSEDAETDGRIREVTDEEEEELVEEAMSEDEPVVEVKIKKQADKKRKTAEEEKEQPAATPAKLSKKAKQAEKKAAAKEAAEKPKQAEKAEKPKQAEKPKAKAATLPGGVIVETKTEGAGAPAKKGQRVGMYYIGKLTNGKVFDQNTKGKPFWFRLGAGEVIKGWDTGIIGMKKGEERRLTIPGPMAYGSRGAPPDIPPHATLVFDIRLVEFK
ncbi:peptidylprolyl isomerase fpr3 [Coemansia sp. S146]|nr:peptidylprolyl isomerase fpr3 [Coemansia sp. S146]